MGSERRGRSQIFVVNNLFTTEKTQQKKHLAGRNARLALTESHHLGKSNKGA